MVCDHSQMGIQIEVTAGETLLQGYTKNALAGLTELIWNALDADATQVDLDVQENPLGGAEELTIVDNGFGMNMVQAERAFGSVGDSWKRRPGAVTEVLKRPVHGREGRGRYAAFGVGNQVVWISRAASMGQAGLHEIVVKGDRASLKRFDISDPKHTEAAAGTTVKIHQLSTDAQNKLLNDEAVTEHLLVTFATHLQRFPDTKISWKGAVLDPAAVQLDVTTVNLELPESISSEATLTIIEWDLKSVPRRLFICDESGSILEDIRARIQAPGAEFTAYLNWSGFRENESRIFLDSEVEEESEASKVVASARAALRTHLALRMRAKEERLISQWQQEQIYPYHGEPASELERTERQAFNVVAMAASRVIEEGRSPKLKKLSLRLIREALASDPSKLQGVLEQVLNLSSERVDELSRLLHRTTLSHVISSSNMVAGRLDFLHMLNALVFDKLSRQQLLERTQLHRMLAEETWVFGEEWALTGDDQRLSAVLRNHVSMLGLDVDLASGPEPKRADGKVAIPDLVLGRKKETTANSFEQLVVELKRPSHKLDPDDLRQLEDYAHAIVKDNRFQQDNVHWEFWLVGNTVHEQLEDKRRSTVLPFGQTQAHEKYSIWVKTWAEVIGDAEHRLKFFKKSLGYSADHDSGIQYLRREHGAYVPPVFQVVDDSHVPADEEQLEQSA